MNHYIRPKKRLGQHFLKDKNIAQRIVMSLSYLHANVLEVGPGTGVLSEFLLSQPDINLYAVEIDDEAINHLQNRFPQLIPQLIKDDFLNLDLSKLFGGEDFCVIGNFPYNISSQIFFKIIEYRDSIPEIVGMVQKEVAERMAAPHGNKTYGILSVLLQRWYNIEYLFTVHENVFVPPPKVKSAVIRLTRNSTKVMDCNETLFVKVVKTAFNQRRKTMRNSLKALLGDNIINHHFMSMRPEQLSIAQFVELTQLVEEKTG
jgi:16S rRNA (adenine1518-N6/adenine1519-N6)-dimethyltransferase